MANFYQHVRNYLDGFSCSNLIEQNKIDNASIINHRLTQHRDFFFSGKNIFFDMSTKATKLTRIGKKELANFHYNHVSDINYLEFLLKLIEIERQDDRDIDTCGVDQGANFYAAKYNLTCIYDYFQCININIEPLLNAYNLSFTLIPEDGINFMQIEGPDSSDPCNDDAPPFQVQ